MVVCVPSPMATGLVVVRFIALTSTTSNVPVFPPGYPATYSVVPFNKPTLAPPTGTVDVMLREATLKLIPAGEPVMDPHSVPQLSTYAVLLSLLKNALTGRAKPAIATAIGAVAVKSISHIVSALLANTSRVLPSGVIAADRADGTRYMFVIPPAIVDVGAVTTSIPPGTVLVVVFGT